MGLIRPRRRPLAWAGRHLLRLVLAAILSCAVTAAAASAVFVTTAPEAVSLLVEPISLLLTPGMVTAMILANAAKPFHHHQHGANAPTHDFTPQAVVFGTFIFYFAFFLAVLAWRARRRRTLTSSATSG